MPWAEMESRAVTQTELEQPQENRGTAWIGDPQGTPKDTPGEADAPHPSPTAGAGTALGSQCVAKPGPEVTCRFSPLQES